MGAEQPTGAPIATERTGPESSLGAAAARRFRRPGPPAGRTERSSRIGTVARGATRFARGWGRPGTVRRMLAAPGPTATGALPQDVRPPRWWTPSADEAAAAGATTDSAGAVSGSAGVPTGAAAGATPLPARGLRRVVGPVPREGSHHPGAVPASMTARVVPMRLPEEVAAVGRMTMPADARSRRITPRPRTGGGDVAAGPAARRAPEADPEPARAPATTIDGGAPPSQLLRRRARVARTVTAARDSAPVARPTATGSSRRRPAAPAGRAAGASDGGSAGPAGAALTPAARPPSTGGVAMDPTSAAAAHPERGQRGAAPTGASRAESPPEAAAAGAPSTRSGGAAHVGAPTGAGASPVAADPGRAASAGDPGAVATVRSGRGPGSLASPAAAWTGPITRVARALSDRIRRSPARVSATAPAPPRLADPAPKLAIRTDTDPPASPQPPTSVLAPTIDQGASTAPGGTVARSAPQASVVDGVHRSSIGPPDPIPSPAERAVHSDAARGADELRRPPIGHRPATGLSAAALPGVGSIRVGEGNRAHPDGEGLAAGGSSFGASAMTIRRLPALSSRARSMPTQVPASGSATGAPAPLAVVAPGSVSADRRGSSAEAASADLPGWRAPARAGAGGPRSGGVRPETVRPHLGSESVWPGSVQPRAVVRRHIRGGLGVEAPRLGRHRVASAPSPGWQPPTGPAGKPGAVPGPARTGMLGGHRGVPAATAVGRSTSTGVIGAAGAGSAVGGHRGAAEVSGLAVLPPRAAPVRSPRTSRASAVAAATAVPPVPAGVGLARAGTGSVGGGAPTGPAGFGPLAAPAAGGEDPTMTSSRGQTRAASPAIEPEPGWVVDVEQRVMDRVDAWLGVELDDRVLRIVEDKLREETERRSWRHGAEAF